MSWVFLVVLSPFTISLSCLHDLMMSDTSAAVEEAPN